MIGERDKPRRLTLPPEEALPRIDAITVNARATWFALLGLLAFVGVTLLGVEDIDFFDASRRTDLPLVGVSVPTLTFFYVAPALTAAVYAYFHFYLMKLWDALAEAPATVKGRRLGDLVHPWLVTDAALWFRRHEGATADRPLRIVSGFTAGALTWGFGWAVLGYAWWRSHTAHLEWMSLWLLALFVFSLWVGASSLHAAWRRVGHGETRVRHHGKWPRRAVLAAAVPLTMVSWMRTEGGIEAALVAWSDWRAPEGEEEDAAYERRRALETGRFSTPWLGAVLLGASPTWNPAAILAPIDLREARIVEKPEGWLDRQAAEAEFRAEWCRRRERPVAACVDPAEREDGKPDADAQAARDSARRGWCGRNDVPQENCDAYFSREEEALLADWEALRAEFLSGLARPSMRGRDLRGADFTGAFLPGLDLRETRMEGAQLREARMEGANLTSARMQGVELHLARLEGANLRLARLERAEMLRTRLERADLSSARMERAALIDARLNGAILELADLESADLRGAHLEQANLEAAQMARAKFGSANLREAKLGGAELAGADLRSARLWRADLRSANFSSAMFAWTDVAGTRARWANFSDARDLSQDQVNSMFGDRATILPEGLRRTDLMDREPLEHWWSDDPDYEAWLAAGAPPGKPLP